MLAIRQRMGFFDGMIVMIGIESLSGENADVRTPSQQLAEQAWACRDIGGKSPVRLIPGEKVDD